MNDYSRLRMLHGEKKKQYPVPCSLKISVNCEGEIMSERKMLQRRCFICRKLYKKLQLLKAKKKLSTIHFVEME